MNLLVRRQPHHQARRQASSRAPERDLQRLQQQNEADRLTGLRGRR